MGIIYYKGDKDMHYHYTEMEIYLMLCLGGIILRGVIERIKCKKNYNKWLRRCNCITCRFSQKCVYSKHYKIKKNEVRTSIR